MPFTDFASMPDLMDAFPVALIVVGENGEIVRHNAHWSTRMHWTQGDAFSQSVHPEDRGLWSGAMACHALREGVIDVLQLRLIDRESMLLWCEVSFQRRGGYVYLSLVDRTAQRKQSIQIQADHRSTTDLLHGLPALIYRGRINREWTMEFVSGGCEGLTGFSAESMRNGLSGTYARLILPEYADYVWEGVQSALLKREGYALTYRIRCADGQIKWVLEKGTGIFTGTGEVLGIEGAIFELPPPGHNALPT